jgi:hypothetical protein
VTPNGFRDLHEHGYLQAFSLSCASVCASGRNLGMREYDRLVKTGTVLLERLSRLSHNMPSWRSVPFRLQYI